MISVLIVLLNEVKYACLFSYLNDGSYFKYNYSQVFN
jgi:hypothetical protein